MLDKLKRLLKRIAVVVATLFGLLLVIGILADPADQEPRPSGTLAVETEGERLVAPAVVPPKGLDGAIASEPVSSDETAGETTAPNNTGQDDNPGSVEAESAEAPAAVVEQETVVDGSQTTHASEVDSDSELLSATVVRVVDGDTIRAMINGREEVVRLLLIDTPEVVDPNRAVEPFGPEASDFVKSLLPEGTAIELERDVSERDRYGRTLFYVYVGGQSVQEQLLARGLARVAVYPPDVKYVDRYREIEAEARAAGLGIWSLEDYGREAAIETPASPPAPSSPPAPASSGPTSVRGSGGYDCPADYPVKGNHSSSGEWIYHVPGGAYYSRTKPEECFKTPKDAEEAGYRASKR